MELLEGKFSTDLTGEDSFFDGFTKGETWNGFACPYFTFEQGQRIVEATNRAAAEWLERAGVKHVPRSIRRGARRFRLLPQAGS